jgi:hypothetical protein
MEMTEEQMKEVAESFTDEEIANYFCIGDKNHFNYRLLYSFCEKHRKLPIRLFKAKVMK